ncbi:FAD binding domain-containing protein [Palleronia abyssalis]|uniref:6-hydroxypseudooxynicotine dehydrogenase complex subunit alpha n=1 Tax=Palleronia abyssalis TaxID=1501240 RepID=A0A2R8C089_9RHOB|nr:xanthine dehydrogenase family protein subunit M [Palleronia abyssalis]SPJ25789.1 6-hydroxypseudooxynicotine dehydrogenase complex subunit alpha [Palleronia abyssalis]
MKAQVGGYARAEDMAHAIRLLADAEGMGRVLAGGQSLVAALNMGLSFGDLLVDITGLSDLRGVREEDDRLVIGALMRHADVATDPLIARHVPLLAQAAPLIAHEAIRNRGTIGGSLAHADPAAEFPACAVALDAVIRLTGPDGEREVAATDFFRDVFETEMREGEILTGIVVPKTQAGERHVIREAARRAGDYAIAGLAVVIRGGAHRIAAFGTGPTPLLCTVAMERLDAGDVDGAVSALSDALDPPSDTQGSAAYRRHLAGVLLHRIATELGEDV